MCAKGGPVFRVVCKCREIVGTDMSVMGLFAPSVLVEICHCPYGSTVDFVPSGNTTHWDK